MLIGTHPRLRHATSEWATIQAITPEMPVYGFVGMLLRAHRQGSQGMKVPGAEVQIVVGL